METAAMVIRDGGLLRVRHLSTLYLSAIWAAAKNLREQRIVILLVSSAPPRALLKSLAASCQVLGVSQSLMGVGEVMFKRKKEHLETLPISCIRENVIFTAPVCVCCDPQVKFCFVFLKKAERETQREKVLSPISDPCLGSFKHRQQWLLFSLWDDPLWVYIEILSSTWTVLPFFQ